MKPVALIEYYTDTDGSIRARLKPVVKINGEVVGTVHGNIEYTTKDKACDHSFKSYSGFSDNYEYCVHCNEKKG